MRREWILECIVNTVQYCIWGSEIKNESSGSPREMPQTAPQSSCTIIRTEIDNFVFPIYTLTLRYFSNTFHHDSAPARPRSREIRALLLNVRRRPIARWKAYLNSYALSTKTELLVCCLFTSLFAKKHTVATLISQKVMVNALRVGFMCIGTP